jgi:ubiquinone/menaquinone biosynthesis C-methylase UbiE
MEFISIGETCLTDAVLEKLHLKKESYPFGSSRSNIEYILQAIGEDFEHFIDPTVLVKQVNAVNQKVMVNTRYSSSEDIYHILSSSLYEFTHHDLDLIENRDSFSRKVERFRNILRSEKEVCFIYYNVISPNRDIVKIFSYLRSFLELLEKKYNKKSKCILWYQTISNAGRKVIINQDKDILSAEFVTPEKWLTDHNWDARGDMDLFGTFFSSSETANFLGETVTINAPSEEIKKANRIMINEKGKAELAYWENRKAVEQDLSKFNMHYVQFYTEHFGLGLEFYNDKKIIDIGCGPRGSLEWADMAAERYGLDPLAYSYLALGAGRQKMKYIASGSETIPFPDGYFDVLCSFNSLDHVDDLDRTIAEIGRVIKSGGTFLLLTDLNHDPTDCEPITFSFDIIEKFKPDFEVMEERHYEKKAGGMYQSIVQNIPYDHSDPTWRYGILSVRFRRRGV